MTDLLTRLESATEGQERELLCEAFDMCFPIATGNFKKYLAFERMVNAHAWTSAAEMLLPEGVDEWKVEHWDSSGIFQEHVLASAWVKGAPRTYAAAPWAALAAACVKARG